MVDPSEMQVFEDILVFVAGIVGMGCLTGVITSYFKRRAPKKIDSPEIAQHLADISERLSRLEYSTDAVALEVERISEGQRFTSKLLAESAADRTPGAGTR